jgi:hypothetical protein
MLFNWTKRAYLAFTLCFAGLVSARAEPNLYGLTQTNGFNKLQAYDLNQDFSDGFKRSYLIPLDYNTNVPLSPPPGR